MRQSVAKWNSIHHPLISVCALVHIWSPTLMMSILSAALTLTVHISACSETALLIKSDLTAQILSDNHMEKLLNPSATRCMAVIYTQDHMDFSSGINYGAVKEWRPLKIHYGAVLVWRALDRNICTQRVVFRNMWFSVHLRKKRRNLLPLCERSLNVRVCWWTSDGSTVIRLLVTFIRLQVYFHIYGGLHQVHFFGKQHFWLQMQHQCGWAHTHTHTHMWQPRIRKR